MQGIDQEGEATLGLAGVAWSDKYYQGAQVL